MVAKDGQLKDILERFNTAKDYYKNEYQRNQEDCEFALGEQWPEQIKDARKKEGRPCLTENRILPFVNQVVNGIRQTKPSIVVKPVDSGSDVKTADVIQGIIKNIETVSDAETAYDTAAYNAVSSGYGWLRVSTKYAGYDTFDQEICIDRIVNPFSVYMDPNSTRMDGSDAEYVFVYDDMPRKDFEKAYPKAAVEGFNGDGFEEWLDDENVRIAEYFYKDYEKKTLYEYEVETFAGVEVVRSYELPEGFEAIRQREVEVCKIKYCKLTACEILEENEFPSSYLPIIPVIGFESWYEGKRQVFSLIHQAKDAQRMFNYWKTASTEVIALQPKAPWVGAKGQFRSNPKAWATANNVNYPFLEYDPVELKGQILPPPQRQAPPTSSGSMMQEALAAADGIKSSLGMYDASLGQNTPDISGKAIISRQMQGDNATYHFVDNLATAMKQLGRVLVDMIPRIYSGARVVRILGNDGSDKMIPLNQPIVKDGQGYRPAVAGDTNVEWRNLEAGKYDVIIEVGPSYATKRQEAANAILELARANPQVYEVAGDLLVQNLDIPNADTIAKRIRSLMDPSLLGEDLEAQRLQQLTEQLGMLQEKLGQTELALQMKEEDQKFKNELELQKLENDRQKIEISAMKTMAEIEKLKAETEQAIPAEAISDISLAVERLKEQFEDVYGAVDIILSEREEGATGAPEALETDEGTIT